MKLEIISETDKYLSVYKPAEVHTTYKNTGDNSDCVVKFVTAEYPELLNVDSKKPREGGLLYRLDYETSGVLIFAKTNAEYRRFYSLQQQEKLLKKYHAICLLDTQNTYKKCMRVDFSGDNFQLEQVVYANPKNDFYGEIVHSSNGRFDAEIGGNYFVIDYPVGHSKKTDKRMIAVKSSKYKTSGTPIKVMTYFKVLLEFSNSILSSKKLAIVEALITKGMRHQIRVHLDAVGLPILGDNLYGPSSKADLNLKLNCSGVYEIGSCLT